MELKIKKFWENNKVKDCLTDPDCLVYAQYLTCLQNRIIILNDRIDDDAIESIVLPLVAMDNDGSGKPITLLLNTTGGYLGSGSAIIHVLEHMKTPTTIYMLGEAFSMGFYISLAGHNNPNVKTVCTPYTRAMYHMSLLSYETDDEPYLEAFQKEYDKTVLYDYVKTHSKITQEMLDDWEGTEKYFTAKELEALEIAKIE